MHENGVFNMKYLNAEKGIKKVYISQFFAIIAAALSGFAELMVDVFNNDLTELLTAHLGIVFAGFALGVILIALIVAFNIIGFFGYYQASKDEPLFKKSVFCVAASGALTVIGTLFKLPNGMLHAIFSNAGTIVQMFVVIFAVSGLIALCGNCSRDDLSGAGDRMLKLLVVTYILSSVNALIIRIFELSAQAKIISVIFGGIDLVLMVLRYAMYLRYLRGVRTMLRENNTDSVRG